MDKGDAFIMLASAFHGGGTNATKDEKRMMFATFVTRGYLRQEENQYAQIRSLICALLIYPRFLAVPPEKARQYPREVLEYMGYSLSDPACGTVEQMDPIYSILPDLKSEAKYKDF
jgi:ectoine hydroxylase-related dioxygenase (phytanoyl-CoA dioxygenase family)